LHGTRHVAARGRGRGHSSTRIMDHWIWILEVWSTGGFSVVFRVFTISLSLALQFLGRLGLEIFALHKGAQGLL